MITLQIRPATPDDFTAIWPIFEAVVREGETYAYDPSIGFDEARAAWMPSVGRTYVAESGDKVVGTYLLKPNQPGLGDHVANAAYMVDPGARGQRVGRALVEHSFGQARALGYRSMVFNLVVATNVGAIALWQSVGFRIVGTLRAAFRHARLGLVDAHIMERSLMDLDPEGRP